MTKFRVYVIAAYRKLDRQQYDEVTGEPGHSYHEEVFEVFLHSQTPPSRKRVKRAAWHAARKLTPRGGQHMTVQSMYVYREPRTVDTLPERIYHVSQKFNHAQFYYNG